MYQNSAHTENIKIFCPDVTGYSSKYFKLILLVHFRLKQVYAGHFLIIILLVLEHCGGNGYIYYIVISNNLYQNCSHIGNINILCGPVQATVNILS